MKSTREGRRFLLATVLIAVAAFNTGNNLIYLILSLMISFLVLSYAVPKVNLAGLIPGISVDGLIFAGGANYGRISIMNTRKLVPGYSIQVDSPSITERASFDRIPASGSVEGRVRLVFDRRGLYPVVTLTVGSSFPFILFYAQRRLDITKDLLVYPAYHDFVQKDNAASAAGGMDRMKPSAGGDDIFRIRAYRYGDDPRRIHWKASAKRATLMTREYAEHESALVTIILDNSSRGAVGDFEKAVSVSASLARIYIERGYLVRVISGGTAVPFGAGDEHLLRILGMLAVMPEEDPGADIAVPDNEGYFIVVLKSAEVNMPASVQTTIGSSGAVIYADTV